ncbi:MAG: hypothetical protein Q8P20_10130 [bacterium]|nr:hypothetical protein [bacterium]
MVQLAIIEVISAFIMIIISITILFGGITLTENIFNTKDALVVNDNNDNESSMDADGSNYSNDGINNDIGQEKYYTNNNSLNRQLTIANNSSAVHLLTYGQEKINYNNSNVQSVELIHINAVRAPPMIT